MQEIWGLMSAYAERGVAEVNELWVTIAPFLDRAAAWVSNPWARAIGLTVIVYLTIRVIASVYSGDKQNSELGPIGIRPHAAQRLAVRQLFYRAP